MVFWLLEERTDGESDCREGHADTGRPPGELCPQASSRQGWGSSASLADSQEVQLQWSYLPLTGVLKYRESELMTKHDLHRVLKKKVPGSRL